MLQKIIDSTLMRVSNLKNTYALKYFQDAVYFDTPCVSLKEYILKKEKNGIIAEFKRISPSKGKLNEYAKVDDVSVQYMSNACSALSILTEPNYFGGSNQDLVIARNYNLCPILRKDFVVDPIQIYESRSIGADAILLIASILTNKQVHEFTTLAVQLGMEVILEMSSVEDIEKFNPDKHIAGINSRNLKTMHVDKNIHYHLIELLGTKSCTIAESGISNVKEILQLKNAGYKGFLIGSVFMKHADPGYACKTLVQQLNQMECCYVY